ncbi:chemotaxis protein CheW [Crenothrix sp.]|uniref:chemotaxis protein CheW n=1 Tax=Crenothrix sp. TaxID=3100433 RepID=UPI00374DB897
MEIDRFEPSNPDSTVKPSSIQALDSLQATEDSKTLTTAPGDLDIDNALGFRIGNIGLLLNASIFCEIVDQAKVSPLPNVQPWLSGVLNLRGNIVPVVDLHILIEQDKTANPKARHLLAVDRGRKTVAFWIDGYPQMINTALLSATTPPALPDVLTHAVTQYKSQDTQIWLNISLDKLFKSLTHHAVQAGA